jgi:hypothetical protein
LVLTLGFGRGQVCVIADGAAGGAQRDGVGATRGLCLVAFRRAALGDGHSPMARLAKTAFLLLAMIHSFILMFIAEGGKS